MGWSVVFRLNTVAALASQTTVDAFADFAWPAAELEGRVQLPFLGLGVGLAVQRHQIGEQDRDALDPPNDRHFDP